MNEDQKYNLFSGGWPNNPGTISFEEDYMKKMTKTSEFTVSYQKETSYANEGEQFLYLRRRRD